MPYHELKQVIEAADRAITAEDFESLMDFYADDATLVIKPGLNATGKPQIKKAFAAIAAHFENQLKIRQGDMRVIEGGDIALVIMETILDTVDTAGAEVPVVRRATYVFRRLDAGKWLCVIDNSYGTALLDG